MRARRRRRASAALPRRRRAPGAAGGPEVAVQQPGRGREAPARRNRAQAAAKTRQRQGTGYACRAHACVPARGARRAGGPTRADSWAGAKGCPPRWHARPHGRACERCSAAGWPSAAPSCSAMVPRPEQQQRARRARKRSARVRPSRCHVTSSLFPSAPPPRACGAASSFRSRAARACEASPRAGRSRRRWRRPVRADRPTCRGASGRGLCDPHAARAATPCAGGCLAERHRAHALVTASSCAARDSVTIRPPAGSVLLRSRTRLVAAGGGSASAADGLVAPVFGAGDKEYYDTYFQITPKPARACPFPRLRADGCRTPVALRAAQLAVCRLARRHRHFSWVCWRAAATPPSHAAS